MQRHHDLDALRGFAMALGIVLHAAAFLGGVPYWPAQEEFAIVTAFPNPYSRLMLGIHGFRMPVFFLLSGFFTALLWRRRGLKRLVDQRLRRIGLPLLIGALTITPLNNWLFGVIELEPGAWITSWFRNFNHLWFLWQLLLIAAIFLLALRLGVRFRHQVWWLLIPATVLPMMMMTDRSFGADTSLGVLPETRVLAYNALFFFFGVFFYQRQLEVRRWWAILLLPAVTVVFHYGVTFLYPEGFPAPEDQADWMPNAAVVLQVIFAWFMCLGLMGLFRLVASKERYWIRFVSDASYWLYLMHLSLVVVLQMLLVDLPVSPHLKFGTIVVAVSAILLLCYRWFVRYTWIGTMLNGKRERPVAGKHRG